MTSGSRRIHRRLVAKDRGLEVIARGAHRRLRQSARWTPCAGPEAAGKTPVPAGRNGLKLVGRLARTANRRLDVIRDQGGQGSRQSARASKARAALTAQAVQLPRLLREKCMSYAQIGDLFIQ